MGTPLKWLMDIPPYFHSDSAFETAIITSPTRLLIDRAKIDVVINNKSKVRRTDRCFSVH